MISLRIKYHGDLPSWFPVVWLALGLTWVIFQVLRDRHRTARVARLPARTSDWKPGDFSLSVYERAIFGIRQVDNTVEFGPSGRAIAGVIIVPLISLFVAGHIATVGPSAVVLVPTMLASLAAFVYGLAGLRLRVWLGLNEIELRGRFGRLRRFAWTDITSVDEEIRTTNVGLHGTTNFAAVGVIHAAGGRPMELPGFRCIAWIDDTGRDDINATKAKIGIVRRYRECLVGPWPKEASSV